VDDIEAHERRYRGSDEETRELKELYARFEGDMDQCVRPSSVQVIWLTRMPQLRVFSWLCCSRVVMDSHRFMETLQVAIDAGAWPCECLMTLVLTLVCVGPQAS
jgi:hypothetical protein